MTTTKTYEVVLKLQTIKDPHELVDVIKTLFQKDAFHITSYDYTELVPRELSVEHHGGYQGRIDPITGLEVGIDGRFIQPNSNQTDDNNLQESTT
jgi:hypothetical protein